MVLHGALKKTFLVSLITHAVCFSIFSMSFGNRLLRPDFAQVSFWGRILSDADLLSIPYCNTDLFHTLSVSALFKRKNSSLSLKKFNPQDFIVAGYYLKPQAIGIARGEKLTFSSDPRLEVKTPVKKEPVIIFYPQLPYHFALYFKDRQAVHIELLFNITPAGKGTSSIALKRKISSGNLEADLLCMRYINRYLFIMQKGFVPNVEQAVNIDLSPNHD